MKNIEKMLGFLLAILLLVLGKFLLSSDMLYFRLIIGVALGYTLSRGYTGFAGSVNRAYRTGSTRLMRTMMMMFFLTTLLSTAFLMNADPTKFDLWINPINVGLILGGILFGFGMTFSSCCASGVLTDLVTALPRALITLIFFAFGVFIGFPIQNTSSIVKDSWFTSEVGSKLYGGVYLPDLFKWDGMKGYLGALILTGLLSAIIIYLAHLYEEKRKQSGTYTGHFGEKIQDIEVTDSHKEVTSETDWYQRLFVNAWSLRKAAVILASLFTLLMGITKAGWGASTPYGLWFGKGLMLFGVKASQLSSFTHMPELAFTTPFFQHPVSVQNFGIIMGTLLFLLTSGTFLKVFKSELKITSKEATFYILGGLLMGFGTRLSNGCNVGALYTPIANFSLSGWVFLIFLVLGGILGNKVAQKVNL
ncbi:YeeE/YedE family protein [Streptococcus uberis]|uniref:YeeE/YedE family protein n=1 Tax=Streptococcus uberis TaxID=1349 RepID=UPI0018E116FE|nr:YeeE/YedE family protein [Streptococcus uberis]MBI0907031.1 YeeE/YedE family protein [Streptococcus uberis]MCK1249579.1 YeeE/YedE family protein [Streptococcus uberis]